MSFVKSYVTSCVTSCVTSFVISLFGVGAATNGGTNSSHLVTRVFSFFLEQLFYLWTAIPAKSAKSAVFDAPTGEDSNNWSTRVEVLPVQHLHAPPAGVCEPAVEGARQPIR